LQHMVSCLSPERIDTVFRSVFLLRELGTYVNAFWRTAADPEAIEVHRSLEKVQRHLSKQQNNLKALRTQIAEVSFYTISVPVRSEKTQTGQFCSLFAYTNRCRDIMNVFIEH
jgi:hypothetical protein